MCRDSECCLALFILGLGRRSIAAGSGEEMPVGQVTAARTMCKLFRMCKLYANYPYTNYTHVTMTTTLSHPTTNTVFSMVPFFPLV